MCIRDSNKLGKVCSPTNPRGRVLGNDDKQCQDGSLVANRKGSKHLDPLSGHYPNKAANLEKISQPNREITSNPSSNTISPNADQGTATRSNKGSAETDELRTVNLTVEGLPKGPTVVGEQYNSLQRLTGQTGEPRNDHIHRCLIKRRVGSIPGRGDIHEGSVDKGREGSTSYQRIRVDSSRDSSEDLLKGEKSETCPHLHGQHDSSTLPDPEGRDKISLSLIHI